MKRIFAALALSFLGSSAWGADIPAKALAIPAITCTPTTCSGWYFGGDIEGAGPLATGQADITNGAGLGAHVGYQFWNGSWFAAFEVGASGYVGQTTFQSAATSQSAATGPVSPGSWSATYLAKAGYGLQGLLNTGSTTAPSQGLFANLNANLLSPYAIVGGRTREFGTGFVSGAGLEYAIGNGFNIDVEYLHINYSTTVNNLPIGNEQVVRIQLNKMF